MKPVQILVAGAFLVAGAALLAGCGERPPIDTVQTGFRGTGMEQVYNPRLVAKVAANNTVPEPLPPADPSGPRASEVYQNVQVLTDLSVGEFTRIMLAMTQWVAPPDQSCNYCHGANMADGSKYTYQVARRMLQMTRTVNTQWKTHVGETGVTCWTCHHGQPVPQYKWFVDPGPPQGETGLIATRAQQNVPAPSTGLATLPYDPFTPFLLKDYPIRMQGETALPAGNVRSIKETEWTYSLMIHMSRSLGVNCTYCHNSRSWQSWYAPPQRTTAWYGIRMARALNNDYLVPLTPVFPANRLGPTGDVAKINCSTCHRGVYKPLFGAPMAKDYPELQGVRAMPVVAPAEGASTVPTDGAAPVAGAATELPVARVYFDVGKPSPIADGAPSLDAVVAFLQANPAAKASISGFHDPTGNAAVNEELAKQRAFHVRDRLVAAGVAAERISLDKPQVTAGSGDLPEARRVEVVVVP